MSIKKEILKSLIDSAKTPKALSKQFNIAETTVRARISELRKEGYYISFPSYIINLQRQAFEKTMTEKNFWNRRLPLAVLSLNLHWSTDDIETFLSKHFSIYKITQLSSNTVIIQKRKT